MHATFLRHFSLALLLLSCAACAGPEIGSPITPLAEIGVLPKPPGLEGVAHGFPALRNLSGETLADGEFTQWIDGDRLHIRIRYDFAPGRWIEERSVIQQEPALVQERWSWEEIRDETVLRRFEVDFLTGTATAEKLEHDELHRWSEHVDVTLGKAFAGSAWALAIKTVHARLLAGEKVRFQSVGFMPKPRAAEVEVSHVSLDRVPMAGRDLSGDRFRIHPLVPAIARLFVEVPDSNIWLAHPSPAAFLRFEGPLGEPNGA